MFTFILLQPMLTFPIFILFIAQHPIRHRSGIHNFCVIDQKMRVREKGKIYKYQYLQSLASKENGTIHREETAKFTRLLFNLSENKLFMKREELDLLRLALRKCTDV